MVNQEAMAVIHRVWEAWIIPCAERLHPALLETAQSLAKPGHLRLTDTILSQLLRLAASPTFLSITLVPITKGQTDGEQAEAVTAS